MARGDHIQTKRMLGLYYHHGIDMGDGTVVHFSGEPLNGAMAVVCRVSEEAFTQGQPRQVVSYDGIEEVLDPEETIALALEQLDNKGYNVFYNNCEHFATYCKTRKKMSRQVRSFTRKLLMVAGTASAVALVLVTDQIRKQHRRNRA